MNFKGVIFDLDGTLVDSLEDLADSMNTVLLNYGYPIHDLDSYRYFIGNGIRNLVRSALPESDREEASIAKCLGLMVKVYNENCTRKTKPYEGIPDLLETLLNRGLKLGVFSNKADAMTKKIVSELFPGYFCIAIGLTDERFKKPDPSGAIRISEEFGLKPEEIVYIGDTGTDMQTAVNAGMKGAGALWGFRTREELLAGGAGNLLSHPLDLLALLQ